MSGSSDRDRRGRGPAGGKPDPQGPPPYPPSAYLEITFPGGGRRDPRPGKPDAPLEVNLRRGPYREENQWLMDDFHGLLPGPTGGAPPPPAGGQAAEVMFPGVIYQRASFNVRYIRPGDEPDSWDPPPPPHPPGKPGSPPPSPGSRRKRRAVPPDNDIPTPICRRRLSEWPDFLNGDGGPETQHGPQSTRQDPGPSSARQQEPQPVQFERRPSEPFQGLKRIGILAIRDAPAGEFISAVNDVMQNTFAGARDYTGLLRSLPNPPLPYMQTTSNGLMDYLAMCCKWIDQLQQRVMDPDKAPSSSDLSEDHLTKVFFFYFFAVKVETIHMCIDPKKGVVADGGGLGSNYPAPLRRSLCPMATSGGAGLYKLVCDSVQLYEEEHLYHLLL